MAKKRDQTPKSQLAVLPTASYDVGYGKPPLETRFAKGQSGNPRGRPKGARSRPPSLGDERLKAIIIDEAYRTVKVNDGNRQVTIPIAQAVVRSMAIQAAKGHHRSQKLFAELLGETERANKALNDAWFNTALDYKIAWDRELDRRAQLGITGPAPLPHPDHIVLDLDNCKVIIKGPMTKEEAERLEGWKQRLVEFKEELVELQAERAKPRCKHAAILDREIENTLKVIELLEILVNRGRIPRWMPDHMVGSEG